ncbi:MAG: hypothetical protein COT00_04455, partial [Candidatus Omnitrophica bacterium CG07_land_8_20_14_0_80_50_8]
NTGIEMRGKNQTVHYLTPSQYLRHLEGRTAMSATGHEGILSSVHGMRTVDGVQIQLAFDLGVFGDPKDEASILQAIRYIRNPGKRRLEKEIEAKRRAIRKKIEGQLAGQSSRVHSDLWGLFESESDVPGIMTAVQATITAIEGGLPEGRTPKAELGAQLQNRQKTIKQNSPGFFEDNKRYGVFLDRLGDVLLNEEYRAEVLRVINDLELQGTIYLVGTREKRRDFAAQYALDSSRDNPVVLAGVEGTEYAELDGRLSANQLNARGKRRVNLQTQDVDGPADVEAKADEFGTENTVGLAGNLYARGITTHCTSRTMAAGGLVVVLPYILKSAAQAMQSLGRTRRGGSAQEGLGKRVQILSVEDVMDLFSEKEDRDRFRVRLAPFIRVDAAGNALPLSRKDAAVVQGIVNDMRNLILQREADQKNKQVAVHRAYEEANDALREFRSALEGEGDLFDALNTLYHDNRTAPMRANFDLAVRRIIAGIDPKAKAEVQEKALRDALESLSFISAGSVNPSDIQPILKLLSSGDPDQAVQALKDYVMRRLKAMLVQKGVVDQFTQFNTDVSQAMELVDALFSQNKGAVQATQQQAHIHKAEKALKARSAFVDGVTRDLALTASQLAELALSPEEKEAKAARNQPSSRKLSPWKKLLTPGVGAGVLLASVYAFMNYGAQRIFGYNLFSILNPQVWMNSHAGQYLTNMPEGYLFYLALAAVSLLILVMSTQTHANKIQKVIQDREQSLALQSADRQGAKAALTAVGFMVLRLLISITVPAAIGILIAIILKTSLITAGVGLVAMIGALAVSLVARLVGSWLLREEISREAAPPESTFAYLFKMMFIPLMGVLLILLFHPTVVMGIVGIAVVAVMVYFGVLSHEVLRNSRDYNQNTSALRAGILKHLHIGERDERGKRKPIDWRPLLWNDYTKAGLVVIAAAAAIVLMPLFASGVLAWVLGAIGIATSIVFSWKAIQFFYGAWQFSSKMSYLDAMRQPAKPTFGYRAIFFVSTVIRGLVNILPAVASLWGLAAMGIVHLSIAIPVLIGVILIILLVMKGYQKYRAHLEQRPFISPVFRFNAWRLRNNAAAAALASIVAGYRKNRKTITNYRDSAIGMISGYGEIPAENDEAGRVPDDVRSLLSALAKTIGSRDPPANGRYARSNKEAIADAVLVDHTDDPDYPLLKAFLISFIDEMDLGETLYSRFLSFMDKSEDQSKLLDRFTSAGMVGGALVGQSGLAVQVESRTNREQTQGMAPGQLGEAGTASQTADYEKMRRAAVTPFYHGLANRWLANRKTAAEKKVFEETARGVAEKHEAAVAVADADYRRVLLNSKALPSEVLAAELRLRRAELARDIDILNTAKKDRALAKKLAQFRQKVEALERAIEVRKQIEPVEANQKQILAADTKAQKEIAGQLKKLRAELAGLIVRAGLDPRINYSATELVRASQTIQDETQAVDEIQLLALERRVKASEASVRDMERRIEQTKQQEAEEHNQKELGIVIKNLVLDDTAAQFDGQIKAAQAEVDQLQKNQPQIPPQFAGLEGLKGLGGMGSPELLRAKRELATLRLQRTQHIYDTIAGQATPQAKKAAAKILEQLNAIDKKIEAAGKKPGQEKLIQRLQEERRKLLELNVDSKDVPGSMVSLLVRLSLENRDIQKEIDSIRQSLKAQSEKAAQERATQKKPVESKKPAIQSFFLRVKNWFARITGHGGQGPLLSGPGAGPGGGSPPPPEKAARIATNIGRNAAASVIGSNPALQPTAQASAALAHQMPKTAAPAGETLTKWQRFGNALNDIVNFFAIFGSPTAADELKPISEESPVTPEPSAQPAPTPAEEKKSGGPSSVETPPLQPARSEAEHPQSQLAPEPAPKPVFAPERAPIPARGTVAPKSAAPAAAPATPAPQATPVVPSSEPKAPATPTQVSQRSLPLGANTMPAEFKVANSPVEGNFSDSNNWNHAGAHWKTVHTGDDTHASRYDRIHAVADGVVVRTGSDKSFGNYVVIAHYSGQTIIGYTFYCHLTSPAGGIKVDDSVTAGTVIGLAGDTGNAFGVHLHFEIHTPAWQPQENLYDPDTTVDPHPFLTGAATVTTDHFMDVIANNRIDDHLKLIADLREQLGQLTQEKDPAGTKADLLRVKIYALYVSMERVYLENLAGQQTNKDLKAYYNEKRHALEYEYGYVLKAVISHMEAGNFSKLFDRPEDHRAFLDALIQFEMKEAQITANLKSTDNKDPREQLNDILKKTRPTLLGLEVKLADVFTVLSKTDRGSWVTVSLAVESLNKGYGASWNPYFDWNQQAFDYYAQQTDNNPSKVISAVLVKIRNDLAVNKDLVISFAEIDRRVKIEIDAMGMDSQRDDAHRLVIRQRIIEALTGISYDRINNLYALLGDQLGPDVSLVHLTSRDRFIRYVKEKFATYENAGFVAQLLQAAKGLGEGPLPADRYELPTPAPPEAPAPATGTPLEADKKAEARRKAEQPTAPETSPAGTQPSVPAPTAPAATPAQTNVPDLTEPIKDLEGKISTKESERAKIQISGSAEARLLDLEIRTMKYLLEWLVLQSKLTDTQDSERAKQEIVVLQNLLAKLNDLRERKLDPTLPPGLTEMKDLETKTSLFSPQQDRVNQFNRELAAIQERLGQERLSQGLGTLDIMQAIERLARLSAGSTETSVKDQTAKLIILYRQYDAAAVKYHQAVTSGFAQIEDQEKSLAELQGLKDQIDVLEDALKKPATRQAEALTQRQEDEARAAAGRTRYPNLERSVSFYQGLLDKVYDQAGYSADSAERKAFQAALSSETPDPAFAELYDQLLARSGLSDAAAVEFQRNIVILATLRVIQHDTRKPWNSDTLRATVRSLIQAGQFTGLSEDDVMSSVISAFLQVNPGSMITLYQWVVSLKRDSAKLISFYDLLNPASLNAILVGQETGVAGIIRKLADSLRKDSDRGAAQPAYDLRNFSQVDLAQGLDSVTANSDAVITAKRNFQSARNAIFGKIKGRAQWNDFINFYADFEYSHSQTTGKLGMFGDHAGKQLRAMHISEEEARNYFETLAAYKQAVMEARRGFADAYFQLALSEKDISRIQYDLKRLETQRAGGLDLNSYLLNRTRLEQALARAISNNRALQAGLRETYPKAVVQDGPIRSGLVGQNDYATVNVRIQERTQTLLKPISFRELNRIRDRRDLSHVSVLLSGVEGGLFDSIHVSYGAELDLGNMLGGSGKVFTGLVSIEGNLFDSRKRADQEIRDLYLKILIQRLQVSKTDAEAARNRTELAIQALEGDPADQGRSPGKIGTLNQEIVSRKAQLSAAIAARNYPEIIRLNNEIAVAEEELANAQQTLALLRTRLVVIASDEKFYDDQIQGLQPGGRRFDDDQNVQIQKAVQTVRSIQTVDPLTGTRRAKPLTAREALVALAGVIQAPENFEGNFWAYDILEVQVVVEDERNRLATQALFGCANWKELVDFLNSPEGKEFVGQNSFKQQALDLHRRHGSGAVWRFINGQPWKDVYGIIQALPWEYQSDPVFQSQIQQRVAAYVADRRQGAAIDPKTGLPRWVTELNGLPDWFIEAVPFAVKDPFIKSGQFKTLQGEGAQRDRANAADAQQTLDQLNPKDTSPAGPPAQDPFERVQREMDPYTAQIKRSSPPFRSAASQGIVQAFTNAMTMLDAQRDVLSDAQYSQIRDKIRDAVMDAILNNENKEEEATAQNKIDAFSQIGTLSIQGSFPRDRRYLVDFTLSQIRLISTTLKTKNADPNNLGTLVKALSFVRADVLSALAEELQSQLDQAVNESGRELLIRQLVDVLYEHEQLTSGSPRTQAQILSEVRSRTAGQTSASIGRRSAIETKVLLYSRYIRTGTRTVKDPQTQEDKEIQLTYNQRAALYDEFLNSIDGYRKDLTDADRIYLETVKTQLRDELTAALHEMDANLAAIQRNRQENVAGPLEALAAERRSPKDKVLIILGLWRQAREYREQMRRSAPSDMIPRELREYEILATKCRFALVQALTSTRSLDGPDGFQTLLESKDTIDPTITVLGIVSDPTAMDSDRRVHARSLTAFLDLFKRAKHPRTELIQALYVELTEKFGDGIVSQEMPGAPQIAASTDAITDFSAARNHETTWSDTPVSALTDLEIDRAERIAAVLSRTHTTVDGGLSIGTEVAFSVFIRINLYKNRAEGEQADLQKDFEILKSAIIRRDMAQAAYLRYMELIRAEAKYALLRKAPAERPEAQLLLNQAAYERETAFSYLSKEVQTALLAKIGSKDTGTGSHYRLDPDVVLSDADLQAMRDSAKEELEALQNEGAIGAGILSGGQSVRPQDLEAVALAKMIAAYQKGVAVAYGRGYASRSFTITLDPITTLIANIFGNLFARHPKPDMARIRAIAGQSSSLIEQFFKSNYTAEQERDLLERGVVEALIRLEETRLHGSPAEIETAERQLANAKFLVRRAYLPAFDYDRLEDLKNSDVEFWKKVL